MTGLFFLWVAVSCSMYNIRIGKVSKIRCRYMGAYIRYCIYPGI